MVVIARLVIRCIIIEAPPTHQVVHSCDAEKPGIVDDHKSGERVMSPISGGAVWYRNSDLPCFCCRSNNECVGMAGAGKVAQIGTGHDNIILVKTGNDRVLAFKTESN